MAKRVHDILWIHLPDRPELEFAIDRPEPARLPPVPVAFIQHGTPEDPPFQYESICPYCAKGLGIFEPPNDNFGTLANLLIADLVKHYKQCPRWGEPHFLVELTKEPLHTEHKLKVH